MTRTQSNPISNDDYLNSYEIPKRSCKLRSYLPAKSEDSNVSKILERHRNEGITDSFILARHWTYKAIVRSNINHIKRYAAENMFKKSNSQDLPIVLDFSTLLDYAGTLTVGHWNSGITWQLEHEGSTQKLKYFDQESVPLTFLLYQESCTQWYLDIPKEVRVNIAAFGTHEFVILYLVSHYTYAYQLFVSQPTLFWIMLSVAKEKEMEESDLLALLARPRKEILQFCDLPTTKSTLKLIGKLRLLRFSQTSLGYIRDLFAIENHSSLNHLKEIRENVVSFVREYPEMIGSSLLLSISKSTNSVINTTIDDIRHLADRLEITDILARISHSKSLAEVNAVHDDLVVQVNAQQYEELFEIDYPEPPIQGNSEIIAITTGEALHREGLEQHHCVSIYHDKIVSGDYYVYQILAPERATLGLTLKKGCKPKLDQLVLALNAEVSEQTKKTVLKWLANNGVQKVKYQKRLDQINNGEYSRGELRKILSNAETMYKNGDDEAKVIVDAITIATPSDTYILFMGFCPDANLANRLDIEWREKGICTFDWEESEGQMAAFQEIRVGDLVVLKKIQVFGKTMEVSGHGRVKSIAKDEQGNNYLIMNWSDQLEAIEVPLMSCNSTVNIKPMETVEDQMPEEFFEWLNS